MDEKEQENNVKGKTNERKISKLKDVIYTVKPLLILESAFGIFRFKTIDGGNIMVPTNPKTKLIGVVIASIYLILFFLCLRFPTALSGIGNIVDMMDEMPTMVILIQYITLEIMTSFFLSETTIRLFMAFSNIDCGLQINMNKDFYKTSRKQTIRYAILFTVCHVAFSITDLVTGYEYLPGKIYTQALYLEQDLEIFVFCKMVFMLRSRLIVINEHLAKFINDKDINKTSIFIVNDKEVVSGGNFNFIGRITPSNMKIRDLAAMYDTIGETCRLINDVFKFQIFMNLVSTFVFIIITIWTSLYYFRKPEDVSSKLLTVVIWCVLTILSVAVMSLTCESLLRTRHNTRLLVNEIIMDYDLPKTMRVQAKVFMELIEAWPLRIFVYDMFSVDIKLMLKFISVATTYLIVVIQISHFI